MSAELFLQLPLEIWVYLFEKHLGNHERIKMILACLFSRQHSATFHSRIMWKTFTRYQCCFCNTKCARNYMPPDDKWSDLVCCQRCAIKFTESGRFMCCPTYLIHKLRQLHPGFSLPPHVTTCWGYDPFNGWFYGRFIIMRRSAWNAQCAPKINVCRASNNGSTIKLSDKLLEYLNIH